MLIFIGGLLITALFAIASMMYAHADRRPAVWLFCAGGIVSMIVAAKFWSDAVAPKSPPAAEAPPAPKPPQDPPTAPASTPVAPNSQPPMPSNNSGQNFNVTSNNQTGGITAGIVNMGPQPRSFDGTQAFQLASALKPFAGQKIQFCVQTSSEEITKLADGIYAGLKEAGLVIDVRAFGMYIDSPPVRNISVRIHDKDKTPPLAQALLNFLIAQKLDARGLAVPDANDWPKDGTDVRLVIGPAGDW
jgi:hypothetical protein